MIERCKFCDQEIPTACQIQHRSIAHESCIENAYGVKFTLPTTREDQDAWLISAAMILVIRDYGILEDDTLE